MKSRLLLPHKYKKFGWMLFIPALLFSLLDLFSILRFEDVQIKSNVFAIVSNSGFGVSDSSGHAFSREQYLKIIQTQIFDEIVLCSLLIGAYLIAFSMQKIEDEYIAHVRLESLLWSVFLNTAILFLSTIFIYGAEYLYVIHINMVSVLLIFIARFNFIIWKNSKGISNE